MPLASLDKKNQGKYIHGPAHDLESLLHVALGVVNFTAGPCGQVRNPNDHVPLAQWYNLTDREQLQKDKAIDLISYEKEIHDNLLDYWKPFSPYLQRLVLATWPELKPLQSGSVATHDTFREILKDALAHFTHNHPENLCNYARITHTGTHTGKRSRPSTEKGRYPYKIRREDVGAIARLPQLAVIKPLEEWKDSVD